MPWRLGNDIHATKIIFVGSAELSRALVLELLSWAAGQGPRKGDRSDAGLGRTENGQPDPVTDPVTIQAKRGLKCLYRRGSTMYSAGPLHPAPIFAITRPHGRTTSASQGVLVRVCVAFLPPGGSRFPCRVSTCGLRRRV
eukprot:366561-Chlamydomonas_euryale.AAC.9